jgi:hypothetical protein
MLTHLARNSVQWPSAVNAAIKPSGSIKFGGVFWLAESLLGSLPRTELILLRLIWSRECGFVLTFVVSRSATTVETWLQHSQAAQVLRYCELDHLRSFRAIRCENHIRSRRAPQTNYQYRGTSSRAVRNVSWRLQSVTASLLPHLFWSNTVLMGWTHFYIAWRLQAHKENWSYVSH